MRTDTEAKVKEDSEKDLDVMLYVAEKSKRMRTGEQFIGFIDIKIIIDEDMRMEPDWRRLKSEEDVRRQRQSM